MKILISNYRLGYRGGAESFLRDLALGLQSAGHEVIVYSANAGRGSRSLEIGSVPLTTDIENLPFVPDVIHAQHHLHAISAITALSGVPAIYHSHGAVWKEWAPRHPRIYRYLAMSRTLKERMIVESNIAPIDIDVVLNGVDLARFQKIRKLPAKPARALFYNSRMNPDSDTVLAIREAASRLELQLDFVGYYFNRTIDAPEKVLPDHDIVFASGISAIEALACGCAVVVLGRSSCGPMVRPGNFEHLRQVNFSVAANLPPPSAEDIERELRRFSAEDCATVSERLRSVADTRLLVEDMVKIYSEVIAHHAGVKPDLRAESIATSKYFQEIVPMVQMTDSLRNGDWDSAMNASTSEELRAQLAMIKRELNQASG